MMFRVKIASECKLRWTVLFREIRFFGGKYQNSMDSDFWRGNLEHVFHLKTLNIFFLNVKL